MGEYNPMLTHRMVDIVERSSLFDYLNHFDVWDEDSLSKPSLEGDMVSDPTNDVTTQTEEVKMEEMIDSHDETVSHPEPLMSLPINYFPKKEIMEHVKEEEVMSMDSKKLMSNWHLGTTYSYPSSHPKKDLKRNTAPKKVKRLRSLTNEERLIQREIQLRRNRETAQRNRNRKKLYEQTLLRTLEGLVREYKYLLEKRGELCLLLRLLQVKLKKLQCISYKEKSR
jgi:hypothetical protein